MRFFVISFMIVVCLSACTVPKIAVDDAGWSQKEELLVKGRNGFFLKEKLSFGEFVTTKVQRSWTTGSGWGWGIGGNHWMERLSIEFVRRKQTVRFQLRDANGNESQVTAFSKIKWTDLSIGNNPNSLVNIIGDVLQIGDDGTNTYAVRIATSPKDTAWEMVIDNNAAQRNARKYTGLLAKSKSQYYIVAPVYQLKNKQGAAVSLPFGGSVGFEFRRPGGETVAAVSLIDKGMVYFDRLPQDEKFLLANAAAALLLQQLLE
jgi:hypothetical protein